MIQIQYPELLVLTKDLHRASDEVKDRALDVAADVIDKVRATGQQLVPRDTGATADSITSEVKAEDGYIAAEAGPTTRHAVFVEFGTWKDAPQAFMGPALDRHSHEWEERLLDAASDIL